MNGSMGMDGWAFVDRFETRFCVHVTVLVVLAWFCDSGEKKGEIDSILCRSCVAQGMGQKL
jgi:hypothetical protein